ALGSNSILNRLPGKKLKLMIMPDNPQKVRRPTLIWFIFGTVFLLPGLFVMKMAVKEFELNYMMVIFIFAILLFGGEKVFKFYKKITKSKFDRELLKEAWIKMKKGRLPKSEDRDVKGEVLEHHQIIEIAKKHLKLNIITVVFLFFATIGFGYGAYYSANSMIHMTNNGLSAPGIVTSIESRDNSDGGYTYYAKVCFTAQDGNQYQITDSIGSSTALYDRGEEVDVLYNPLTPDDGMIDRGIFNWWISVIAGLLCIWSLWGFFIFSTAKRRFNKHMLKIP
ncbi:MAG: DUF3592 domain-containing protein, partial [Emcibacteraceae bacterium]|nr:DUF3592 domain-containing protein [Emcibacteraceae bacterium]